MQADYYYFKQNYQKALEFYQNSLGNYNQNIIYLYAS